MRRFTGDEVFDAIDAAAARRPEEQALHFVRDTSGARADFSRAQVADLVRSGASCYRSRGLEPGARVLVDLPTGEGYVAAVLGAFHAGLLPASIAPLSLRRGKGAVSEWRQLVKTLAPAVVVSEQELPDEGVRVVRPDELLGADPAAAGERVPGAEMAYVQFSSGSTGTPKALRLDMPGVVFNLEAMARHIPVDPGDRFWSWLPMYHDMGLFGVLMLALYTGVDLTLMDPGLFVKSPLLWFRVLHDIRATITVGPPSAYKSALEMLRRRPIEGLDVSSCTRYICGAELVTPGLVQTFDEVLGPRGAAPHALKPVYGMSEITLTATMPPHGRAPLMDWVDRHALEGEHRAEPVRREHPDAVGWVSVGQILGGQEMRVVSETGMQLPERSVGRVHLQSPSLFSGFVDGAGFTPREPGWLDTGDLGYRVGSELFITGRAKEIIIKGGRNYSPERLEEIATLAPGASRAAAFGVFHPARETEQVVVLIEAHPRETAQPEQRDRLRLAVRTELGAAGYEVDEVILVARGSLPRTTSGKLRRKECREHYLEQMRESEAS